MPKQGDDTADHPRELQCLVGKSYLFKVQINKDNIEDPEGTKFHVHMICNNDMIIRTFNKNQVHKVV